MLTAVAQRWIACLVLVTFTSLVLQPLSAVAQEPELATTDSSGMDEGYGRELEALRGILEQPQDNTRGRIGPAQDDRVAQVLASKRTLEQLEVQVDQGFAATAQLLRDHGLPAEVVKRHHLAVEEFKARQAELKHLLQDLEQAVQAQDTTRAQALVQALTEFMTRHQLKRSPPPLDPQQLPFRTPDSQVRPPKESEAEFRATLLEPLPVQLAGPIPDGLPATGLDLTPGPEDLAETEEAPITPAIRALAESLGKQPVRIYNWVRNNIQFVPTYGLIQGAEMTLHTRQGNAFDTASLLIALLRASDIPARYVYGTIQVPMERALNWVGGVSRPEAALSLLGQGGIPSVGLVAGGTFKAVKLEHVWVEAWVDYYPSRGAIHREGDAWVPLDAAFKQYQFTPGLDLQTQVPFEAQSLMDQVKAGVTLDEQQGWAAGLDQSLIQNALTDYQNRVKAYLDSQNSNAGLDKVIGTKQIIA